MKILLSLIFISSNVGAFSWSSGMHHIEPLYQESEVAIQESGSVICSDPVPPFKYISDKPKTEVWRSYFKVPKLLTADLYKVKDVCEEAKKMNHQQGVNKKYALVANKSHQCDTGAGACLSMFKSISDPCNSFVQDNFQIFHARTTISRHITSGSKEIMREYGEQGPSLLVINLETCQLMPTIEGEKAIARGVSATNAAKDGYFFTPPSLESSKDEKGVYKYKSENDHVRFDAMRDALTTNIPELKAIEGKTDCFIDGKRTLPGMGDKDDIQYGDIATKGLLGIRKLLDEQYIEKTGINPYK